MAMYPDGKRTCGRLLHRERPKTQGLDDAWSSRASSAKLQGDWYVQRQWCLIAGLDNPYPEM